MEDAYHANHPRDGHSAEPVSRSLTLPTVWRAIGPTPIPSSGSSVPCPGYFPIQCEKPIQGIVELCGTSIIVMEQTCRADFAHPAVFQRENVGG